MALHRIYSPTKDAIAMLYLDPVAGKFDFSFPFQFPADLVTRHGFLRTLDGKAGPFSLPIVEVSFLFF